MSKNCHSLEFVLIYCKNLTPGSLYLVRSLNFQNPGVPHVCWEQWNFARGTCAAAKAHLPICTRHHPFPKFPIKGGPPTLLKSLLVQPLNCALLYRYGDSVSVSPTPLCLFPFDCSLTLRQPSCLARYVSRSLFVSKPFGGWESYTESHVFPYTRTLLYARKCAIAHPSVSLIVTCSRFRSPILCQSPHCWLYLRASPIVFACALFLANRLFF